MFCIKPKTLRDLRGTKHKQLLQRLNDICKAYCTIADVRLHNVELQRETGLEVYKRYMTTVREDLFNDNKSADAEINIKTFYLK